MKVGKPALAPDNVQFFHLRIAHRRLRSKENTMKDTIRQLIQQALTQLVNEGVLPEGLTPAILTSDDAIKQQPQIVRGVVQGTLQGMRDIIQDPRARRRRSGIPSPSWRCRWRPRSC